MSGFLGADTQSLREYAEKARAASSRLSELRDALSSSVASVEWRGADGDAFRDDFSGRVSGMFDTVGVGSNGPAMI
ncbi:hypothetical protein [Brachybacterium kimchii]|uniref:WXG100 family type VII secretion target n=1 Tax=Brachybacterium kimchii TaxID=2942909 RepID=A0ABY4N226_9MICO|nr:hypothetical protein [Brachybacterium kimchii]UQN28179.1 hypothetical protein M4486_11000 [Brachybacterium kimchii]